MPANSLFVQCCLTGRHRKISWFFALEFLNGIADHAGICRVDILELAVRTNYGETLTHVIEDLQRKVSLRLQSFLCLQLLGDIEQNALPILWLAIFVQDDFGIVS